MRQINDLIEKLCPNGVEWKALGEVCDILRGKRLTTKELSSAEGYPVFHGGVEPIGYYHISNRPANTVMVINVGASAGTVGFCDKDFWSSDGCFCISHNDKIDSKFLFFYLLGCEHQIKSKVRHAGIPTLDNKVVESLQIPLPSIEIQNRIVEILDHFTNLTANLTAELNLRRKQFNHYREILLSLDGVPGVENGVLLDMLKQPITDGPHETPKFVDVGIPFLSAEAVVNSKIDFNKMRGYISEEYNAICCKKYKPQMNDVYVVKSGSTVGKIAMVDFDSEFNIWSPLAALRVNEHNSPRYLYYLLLSDSIQNQIQLKCSKGSQPNLSMRVLEKFEVSIPPLTVQQSIVEKLDKFTALIENIEQELDLRQKQFEYYREQLLSF